MSNPHILVIPYPAQGHVIPLMELSQRLANHGFKITFVNTESTHERIAKASAKEGNIGDRNQIHLVSIPDELQSVEGRNKPDKRTGRTMPQLIPEKIEELIEQINASDSDKISCVLADRTIGCALEIAQRKEIKLAVFITAAAGILVQGFSIPKLIENGIIDEEGTPINNQKIKLSPTMSEVNSTDFVWTRFDDMNMRKIIFKQIVRNNEYTKLADWVLCNSTYELEPGAFDFAPQILPIGPLLAINRFGDSAGNFWPEDSTCLKWLDQQPPESVIYIAFGSSAVCSPTQLQEFALGLEDSNRPFLWVVRSDVTNGTSDAFFQEFQDKIGTQGKVVTWAPQQKVLAHPSIACFVSHCGWNSTIEGASNGVPILCWPYFADQFFNQIYICDKWKTGLGLNKDENGMVLRGEIKNKVDHLLSNKELKARALDLKEMVMNSINEGGSSYKNLKKFVEWIES